MPGGRPLTLDQPEGQEIVEAFLRRIEKGMSAKGAARVSGLSTTTLYRWLETASEDGAPESYVLFRDRFMRARGVREETLIDALASAGRGEVGGDWRAPAWMLERLEPEEYGSKSKVEVGGDVTVKLLQVEGLPEAD